MSLRYVAPQSSSATAQFPYMPHEGPKRGVGPYRSAGTAGPRRGTGKPPVIRGPPTYPALRPSTTVSRSPTAAPPPRVTITRRADGSVCFGAPHEGPKRGIGLGPGAVRHRDVYRPHEGPKRGVGPAPIVVTSSVDTREEQECLNLVNKFRRENGLPSLVFSRRLTSIAQPHTDAMLSGRTPLGHSGFNERSGRVPSAISTGENVGYEKGYSNPVQTLVDGWINSPPHRKNLLGNFNQMGCAFAHRGDLWYGTQFFALI